MGNPSNVLAISLEVVLSYIYTSSIKPYIHEHMQTCITIQQLKIVYRAIRYLWVNFFNNIISKLNHSCKYNYNIIAYYIISWLLARHVRHNIHCIPDNKLKKNIYICLLYTLITDN